MTHVTKYLDVPRVEEALIKILDERQELKRRQNYLRQQTFRLKRLIHNHKQLVLELEDN